MEPPTVAPLYLQLLAVVALLILGVFALLRRIHPVTGLHANYLFLGMGFTLGVILPFSRKHESQSDLLGAKYMHKAGYDPYQAVKLWEKMAEGSTRRQPEFLSTHPDPSRRARDLHNYIKYQEKLGSQGWQSIKMPKAS